MHCHFSSSCITPTYYYQPWTIICSLQLQTLQWSPAPTATKRKPVKSNSKHARPAKWWNTAAVIAKWSIARSTNRRARSGLWNYTKKSYIKILQIQRNAPSACSLCHLIEGKLGSNRAAEKVSAKVAFMLSVRRMLGMAKDGKISGHVHSAEHLLWGRTRR